MRAMRTVLASTMIAQVRWAAQGQMSHGGCGFLPLGATLCTKRKGSATRREDASMHSGTGGANRDPSTPFVTRFARDKFRSG
jgi:hypothetical protein